MQTLDASQDGGEQLEQLDWILIDAPCSNPSPNPSDWHDGGFWAILAQR